MRMEGFKDYFKILGVSKNATQKEIKFAFRKLAREFHPDLNPSENKSEANFKEINEAYEVLSDPDKKKIYEQYANYWAKLKGLNSRDFSKEGFASGFESYKNFDEFLKDLLGRFKGVGQDIFSRFSSEQYFQPWNDSNKNLNLDAVFNLKITFSEAFHGVKKSLLVNNERIDIKIPKGVKSGLRMRLQTKGNIQPGRGKRGDLFLLINVESHPIWKVEGRNIFAVLPVAIDELALGANVPVITPEGTTYLLIPPGTSPGEELKLKGKGWPDSEGSGDLFFNLKLQVPSQWSSKELELFEELRDLRMDEPRSNWFDEART